MYSYSQYQFNNVIPNFIQDETALYPHWEQTKGSWITTSKGKVKIVFPGVRNNRSGPDYLNAVIQLKTGSLIQGHVEIHTKSSQWAEHNHHKDSEFQNVLLHVFKVRNAAPRPNLMEYILLPNYLLDSVEDPCLNLTHPQKSLLDILESMGEIRWGQKVKQIKSIASVELIYNLFKFIHFKGEKKSVRKLSYAFIYFQNNAKEWHDTYEPMFQLCKQIKWKMGGRRPSSQPINRLALILKIGWLLMHHPTRLPTDINGMIKIIDSLKSEGYLVPGHAFAVEILGNIVLPFIESCMEGSYYVNWKHLPGTEYSVIKSRLKIWGIKPSLNYAHVQGILLLDKDYCSANNCDQCPVMNCTEPCLQ